MILPQIQVERASPYNTPSNSDEEDHCLQSSPGYHPARSPSSQLQLSASLSRCTPSRRKRDTDCTTLSSSRKTTVDKADPNSGRCLVTGAPKENVIVMHCHLLPQRCRYNHDLLTKLEWAWGLKYDTLHVDTHLNIILLREDWHKLFDFPRWFLLPSRDIVDLLEEHGTQARRPPIHEVYKDRDVFEYRLVPMMAKIDNIFRYDWPETVASPSRQPTPSDLNSVDSTRHKYPFTTLPTLISHVQPHFAIYNFGDKVAGRVENYPAIVAEIFGISLGDAAIFLLQLVRVYTTWMDKPPEVFKSKGTDPRRRSFDSEPEDGDNNSCPSRPSKRTRRSPSDSGSRAQGQGGGQSDTQLMLHRALNPPVAITPEPDYDGTDIDTDTVRCSSSNELDIQVDSEPMQYASVLAWANQTSSAAASEGWESITVNDKQLGRYPEEFAHPLQ